MPSNTYNPGSDFTPSSGYGNRSHPMNPLKTEFHGGVDFSAPTGTSIPAASSGTVEYSGYNPSGYGNTVVIRHQGSDGTPYHTVYAHQNGNKMPKVGDTINQGDKIGEVGKTGVSTGPHLHFEVLNKDANVNKASGGKMGFTSSDPTIRTDPNNFKNWADGGSPHQDAKPAQQIPTSPPPSTMGDFEGNSDSPMTVADTEGDVYDHVHLADNADLDIAPEMAAPMAVTENVPPAPTLLTSTDPSPILNGDMAQLPSSVSALNDNNIGTSYMAAPIDVPPVPTLLTSDTLDVA